jgi:hypothetical protein
MNFRQSFKKFLIKSLLSNVEANIYEHYQTLLQENVMLRNQNQLIIQLVPVKHRGPILSVLQETQRQYDRIAPKLKSVFPARGMK